MVHHQYAVCENALLLRFKKLSLHWKPMKHQGKYMSPASADYLGLDPDQYWDANNALRFIDTIRVRAPYKLSDPTVAGLLGRNTRTVRRGFELIWYTGTIRTLSGALVHITYWPWTKKGNSFIYLKFSIPKVLQGQNFSVLPVGTDLMAALRKELIPVFWALAMPVDDVVLWETRYIDFSINFQVGDKAHNYLSYARTRTMPQRVRCDYNNMTRKVAGRDMSVNGVCFKSKSVRTTLYDKALESGSADVEEKLRLESSHRTAKAVQKIFQSKHPRLIDLTTNLCQRVFHRDMEILGLNKPIRYIQDCYSLLREKGFNSKIALKLAGFIGIERSNPGLTPKELHAITGISAHLIRKFRRELKKLDCSIQHDEEIELPALSLEALDDTFSHTDGIECFDTSGAHDDKNGTKLLCNTFITLPLPNIPQPVTSYDNKDCRELPGQADPVYDKLLQSSVTTPVMVQSIDRAGMPGRSFQILSWTTRP